MAYASVEGDADHKVYEEEEEIPRHTRQRHRLAPQKFCGFILQVPQVVSDIDLGFGAWGLGFGV